MYLPHFEFLPLSLIFSWTIDIALAQKGDSGYVYCYQPCMVAACGDAFFNDCTCGYNTKFDIMNCTARTCWDGNQASRDSLSFLRQCSMIPFSYPYMPVSLYIPKSLPFVTHRCLLLPWPVPLVKSLSPYTFLPYHLHRSLFVRNLHL